MKSFSISEVRNHLPRVIDRVRQGNEVIVVTRHGKPVADIVAHKKKSADRPSYPLRGIPVKIAPDFDAPMPEIWGELRR